MKNFLLVLARDFLLFSSRILGLGIVGARRRSASQRQHDRNEFGNKNNDEYRTGGTKIRQVRLIFRVFGFRFVAQAGPSRDSVQRLYRHPLIVDGSSCSKPEYLPALVNGLP